jgi:flagellar assembly protein FliH
MEEKMKELVHIYELAGTNPKTDALNPDFVEGILADEMTGDDVSVETGISGAGTERKNIPMAEQGEPHSESPEQLVEDAKDEANRILEEARTRADQMLLEANEKAKALYEEQKDIGYKDGTAAGEQELSRRLADMEATNNSRQMELEGEYQQKLGSMESDLVDAIIQVFDKVFHIQFEEKQDILLHLINDTLYSIEPGKHFRILVSEEDFQYVEDHLSELREQLGKEVTLEVTRDPKMSKSECRIETETGIYDCSMDLELDGLCRDIRSLCG